MAARSGQSRFDPSYSEEVVLADERRVVLRLIRPTDKQGLQRGLERMTPQSRYLRFLAPRSELTEAELRYLSELDGVDHFALGAEVSTTEGAGEGVAVARFVRVEDEPQTADIALAVIDDYQGLGLGRVMIRRLALAALERGVVKFRGDVLSENRRMRALMKGLGRVEAQRAEYGVMTMEVTLTTPALPVRGGGRPVTPPAPAVSTLNGV